jgi:hypothetical protein
VEGAGLCHLHAADADHAVAAGIGLAGDGADRGGDHHRGGDQDAAGRGGYGQLKFFINDNTGLYEGSTLACVAIALVPLGLWLGRTIFPPEWRTRWFSYGLAFAAVLIPVGTEARTGLICGCWR